MMTLPWLKKRNQNTGSSVIKMAEGGALEEDYSSEGLHAAAMDLIEAIHSKDAAKVAQALQAAFELCDSEPHAEGVHVNGETI